MQGEATCRRSTGWADAATAQGRQEPQGLGEAAGLSWSLCRREDHGPGAP